MPFDPQAHRQLMVRHFLWLEQRNPEYARWALDAYRRDPNCPCPDILASVKAAKAVASAEVKCDQEKP